MTEEDALLARIREEPESDEPRLVYADWLQQRGDSYGEMIALGIELDRCGDDERSKELRTRIEGLPCHADWTARLGTTPVLRRGMPAYALLLQEMLVPELVQRVRGSYVQNLHVKCDGLEDHQVACLRDALEYMAVRELTTYCPAGDVGAILAGCDTVERITINGATNAHIEILAAARLPKLVAASTGYSSTIDDGGAIALGTIGTLRELDLPRGKIGPAGIGRILDRIAPEKLVVSHNPIGDLGVIRICRTRGLRELEIDGTDYTEAAIEVLAESEELAASLQKLVLASSGNSGGSNLTPRGLRLLIESHLSRDLELGIDGYALGLEASVQTRFDYAEDTYIVWLTEPSGAIAERFKIRVVGLPEQGWLESWS